MLKKFFFNALSSFVGAWVAIAVCVLGLILLILGIAASFLNKETEKLEALSILRIDLSGTIEENEKEPQLDYRLLLSGKLEQPQTLKDLVSAIREAKKNSKIEAIYIECNGVSAGAATLDALRHELLSFKESGKRIFAYGDNLEMGDYYVATVADEVFLNPGGTLDLQGINGTSLYFKDLLDKVGIDVQAVRVGTFKSAIEPFTSNQMSEPARMQLDSLYTEMWQYILKGIADERKVKATTIDSLVNKFIALDEAATAKKYKLVDDCLYERQVMDKMASYVGKNPQKLNFISASTLNVPNMNLNIETSNQIAVLYAVGDIAENTGAGIDCAVLVPIIVRLAEEDNVKGLVLRVNSPGGSVFGSEQIGEALDYFKSKGKPLAVSMGDYAASGGYWISAGADYIFADPLTVTGSIGIFGLVPNIGKLVDKIGIHPQSVGTNPSIAFPSIFYPMTAEQEDALQKSINRGYDKFINRVATGRHKKPEYIRSIAEGRVWNAIKAKELGLVDELGYLQNAIDWTAKKANVDKPNVVSYPASEENILSIIASSASAKNGEIALMMEKLKKEGLEERMVDFLRWFLQQNHVQARSPYYKITI